MFMASNHSENGGATLLTGIDIILRAWNDLEVFGFLTRPTLAKIDANGGMDNNIIYAVLHEAIYCQG